MFECMCFRSLKSLIDLKFLQNVGILSNLKKKLSNIVQNEIDISNVIFLFFNRLHKVFLLNSKKNCQIILKSKLILLQILQNHLKETGLHI